MKNIVLGLFLLLAYQVSAVNFSFRVQCSSKESPDLLSVFNKIPERQVYIMPTGSALYFSGGYFDAYTEAKNRLDEVKKLGIKDAFIRVFKNRTYLSDEVSANLLEKLSKEKNRLALNLNNTSFKNAGNDYRVNQSEENRQAILIAKAKKKRLEKSNAKNNDKIGDDKIVKKGLYPTDFMVNVTEAPSYKILVATAEGEEMKEDFSDLNEVVYENKLGNKVYYTIGYFASEKEAFEAIGKYKKGNNYKIVGMYRNMVVSKDMANDLKRIFELAKNK